MRFIIVGCGVAGVTAAKKLRELMPASDIVLLDREGLGLYSRMRLPEVLAGKLPETKLVLSSGDSLRALGIDWRGGVSAQSFDPKAKTVLLSTGETLVYDRLILALGASASLPPVKGALPSMTFRSLDDLHHILSGAAHAESAIVVGGGLLGLEAAYALHQRGIKVSIIECMPRLLPRQLNEIESRILLEKFEEFGYTVYTGCSVESLKEVLSGWCATLSTGEELTGDLVLFSAGIRPNTELAKNAGAAVERGIVVGECFETSLPDVYAIGDCAQFGGIVYGLWMASKDQGEAAAGILAGKQDSFAPPAYTPSLKIPGIQLKEIRLAAEHYESK